MNNKSRALSAIFIDCLNRLDTEFFKGIIANPEFVLFHPIAADMLAECNKRLERRRLIAAIKTHMHQMNIDELKQLKASIQQRRADIKEVLV